MENKDDYIMQLLKSRTGQLTIVKLKNGQSVRVFNVAYGYDLGDEFAHITTNISPSIDAEAIDFFYTNEIIDVIVQ